MNRFARLARALLATGILIPLGELLAYRIAARKPAHAHDHGPPPYLVYGLFGLGVAAVVLVVGISLGALHVRGSAVPRQRADLVLLAVAFITLAALIVLGIDLSRF